MAAFDDFYRHYYGQEHIRALIWEQFKDRDFAVGSSPVLSHRGWTFPVRVVPREQVFSLVDQGLDLFCPLRSSEDRELLVIWDLEYFNNDSHSFLYGENGKNQRMAFEWMEPIINEITGVLNKYGIKYILDTTASGYHVWSKISAGSGTFSEFAAEGHLENSLRDKYKSIYPGDIKRTKALPEELGLAYNTAGKVLEFLTQKVMRIVKEKGISLPITVSDTSAGGDHYPRSGFSSDLTQYAHPVFMRVIRTVGSLHSKVLKYYRTGAPAVDIMRLPGMKIDDILTTMWDAGRASLFYKGKDCSVPVSDDGWLKALRDYQKTSLRAWHRNFENMPITELETIAKEHPPCIQQNVFWENAHTCLLQPGHLQLIAEYYTAIGENIKRIALAIGRKYDNPGYGWYDTTAMSGIDWKKYDPYTAANFWMRVYSSLYSEGLGRGLSCRKIQNAGICPIRDCGYRLEAIAGEGKAKPERIMTPVKKKPAAKKAVLPQEKKTVRKTVHKRKKSE